MKPIIRIENISKQYLIGENQKPPTLLREYLTDLVRSPRRSFSRYKINEKNSFWALQNVSFEVKPGEIVGIIGRNGAGKSTLLKIISRITEPTGGRIELYGRIGSLLEVGTGFHPDLTGRENVFLNGTILGMKRDEISAKFDEIVDFAGISKFLDTPVKHYSSGMYMRLAFAVAAHLETEILIVDEVLAVGDAEFQKKCLGKMVEANKQGRTILFVSHSIGAVRQFCNKGIYLERGEVKFNGKINEAVDFYLEKSTAKSKAFVRTECNKAVGFGSNQISFKKISLGLTSGMEIYDFGTDEPIVFKFDLEIETFHKKAVILLRILNKDKIPVCAFQSNELKPEMTLQIEPNFLVRGVYSFHASIHIPPNIEFDYVDDAVMFEIHDATSDFKVYEAFDYGMVFGKGKWG